MAVARVSLQKIATMCKSGTRAKATVKFVRDSRLVRFFAIAIGLTLQGNRC
jgi:hypothetical protein